MLNVKMSPLSHHRAPSSCGITQQTISDFGKNASLEATRETVGAISG